MKVAYVANTNLIELIGLYSEVEAAYVNDATCTVTVKDAAGVNVTGVTWPVTLSYVTASSGDYRGILPDGAGLSGMAHYTSEIEVNAGTNRIGHWSFPFQAKLRVE